MFEAHQGHIAGAQRVQRGRFLNGAKLVTFDVRMSNTAGNSTSSSCRPRTDGAVALAMVTRSSSRSSTTRVPDQWTNVTVKDLEGDADYTPGPSRPTVPAATSAHRP